MRRAAALFAVALLTSAAWAAPQGGPPPRRILFIGNSFTYFNDGVGTHLQKLAISADALHAAEYMTKMEAVGGASLHQLEGKLSILKSEKFDVVVLQGQSTEPIADRDAAARFRSAARLFDKAIRGAGARTVLYMTWAYREHPEMTEPLATAYTAAGEELHAVVAPVGLAFSSAQALVNLYDPDGHHPSVAGTYLAACVFYAALYGKSPEGLTYWGGLPELTARSLQRVAWETVRAYGSR